MTAYAGGAGSSGPTSPTDAPGNAPSRGLHGHNPGAPLSSKDINTDALDGIMESLNNDPKSLDMATLAPLRDQLEKFEADPETDWGDDPAVGKLSATVQAIVAEQMRRLDALAAEEMDRFFDAVDACEAPRQSMIDDERQYRALSRIRDSKRYPSDAPDRDIQDDDRICMHTTRTRTTMYAARLGDMIYPTNDYPVRIVAPTNPDPADYPGFAEAQQKAFEEATQAYQAAAQAAQQQQGPPPGDAPTLEGALSIKDYADESASLMQQWVFKNYDEQNLTRKGRESLERGARVGCGLLYGPFPEISRKRTPRMQDGQMGLDMQVEETSVPGIEARDPFRFFYDMTPTMEESNACYYLNLWTTRQLSEFKEYPNVITTNVDELLALKEPPVDSKIATCLDNRSNQTGMKEAYKDRYPVIEVDRILKPDKLKELIGMEWDSPDLPLIKMWLCDKKCLKFKLTPLEHDWRPPYYNIGIMPKDDTVFWYSVPTMGRAGQKGIDAALNATLFNAAAASAPMIITNRGQVAPSNERWRINGMVVFNNLNPDLPADNVMKSFTIDSNVEGNLEMLDRMLALFDDDVLFEQILSGNLAGEAIAASQLAQLVNLASVFQRRLAGYVDDYQIGPLTTRMVWWGNLYGEDIAMKGPHVVKPIAATQFVSKDILIQHLQAFSQMADNPRYVGFVDDYKLFRINASLLDVPDLNDAINPRDKALAARAQAQQNQGGADAAKMADVQRQAQKDQADVELAKAKLNQDGQLEIQRMNTDLQIQAMKLKQAALELMTSKEVDMAEINADLSKAAQDNVVYARLETMKLTAPQGHNPFSAKD